MHQASSSELLLSFQTVFGFVVNQVLLLGMRVVGLNSLQCCHLHSTALHIIHGQGKGE